MLSEFCRVGSITDKAHFLVATWKRLDVDQMWKPFLINNLIGENDLPPDLTLFWPYRPATRIWILGGSEWTSRTVTSAFHSSSHLSQFPQLKCAPDLGHHEWELNLNYLHSRTMIFPSTFELICFLVSSIIGIYCDDFNGCDDFNCYIVLICSWIVFVSLLF